MLKKTHYISGIAITLFVTAHLFNHIYSLFGADFHVALMNNFRIVYRNIIIESILIIAVGIQIVSGLILFSKKRKSATNFFEKLQIWSGFYLALFFVIHLSAVFTGRYILNLDTNFYFGVAGLNTFPLYFFFVPYYGFAILSFFSHIAGIHYKKVSNHHFGFSPRKQSIGIIIFGLFVSIIILYGLTNGFKGVEIPETYNVIIGK
tara:strand:- start:561 stop:1175 length:615 start_codon:yes stop_codon:yes gene_type:complete